MIGELITFLFKAIFKVMSIMWKFIFSVIKYYYMMMKQYFSEVREERKLSKKYDVAYSQEME